MAEGKAIALINFNGNSLELWEPDSGRDRIVVRPLEHDRIICLGLSPDGKTIACGTVSGSLELRSAVTWDLKATVVADGGPVLRVAFAPDGKRLATGGREALAKIWTVDALLSRKESR
jgi:WD40 repeat protein